MTDFVCNGKLTAYSQTSYSPHFPACVLFDVVKSSYLINVGKTNGLWNTSHKCQGQTVKRPATLVADIDSIFSAGMAYVIFGCVQALCKQERKRENVTHQLTLLECFIVSRQRERESARDVSTRPHKLVYQSLVHHLTQ
jgi:hypothetical protein